MRSIWLVCLILIPAFAAAKEWSYRALGGRKVQLQKTVEAGRDLMVLVDTACLGVAASAAQSKAVQSVLGPSLSVQHKSFADLKIAAVPVSALQTISALEAEHIAAHPCVKGVSENPTFRIQSADPELNTQAHLNAIAQFSADGIFNHPLYGINQAVTVAVVDTGVQASHPDLAARMWRGPAGEIGYDFFNGDADPDDDNGHGTHVAGIIGAQSNNGIGGRGVTGNFAKLMAVKTQSKDGGGMLNDLVNGIRWAADKGAEVINLSIAGKEDAAVLRDAVEYAISKNAVVVVASGNDGQEITAANLFTPVGYAKDYAGMIGVGAFDLLDFTRPTFSNFSPAYVEMSAPGANGTRGIFSTFYQSRYIAVDGTSMAAPQVSAAAALALAFMKSHNRSLTPAQVEEMIEQAATVDQGLATSFASGRRLNTRRLGEMLLQSTIVDSAGGFDAP